MKQKQLPEVNETNVKPWFIMLKVMLTIVIAEAAIMGVFAIIPLPELNNYELAALDALLLAVSTSPVLYFSLFLPLQQQAINEQKARFVMYDSLTNLPRRELFRELVEYEMDVARRSFFSAAMIVINPRRIAETNQSLGYKVGDKLFSLIAVRLQSSLGKSDIICRLGGSEFGLFLPDTDIKRVETIIKKTMLLFEEPFEIKDLHFEINIEVGISLFPDHADTASNLIRKASMACSRAKKEKVPFAIFEDQDEADSHQRLVFLGQLRKAIKEKELELHYQPKMLLSNKQVAGVEALIRWHGESGRPPSEFIPLAEQTGLINDITQWVFKEAVDQCDKWRAQEVHMPISINVSSRNLYNVKLIDYFIHYAEKKSIPYALITIEVTESDIMKNPEAAIKMLSKLKQKGFGISIDDFGTGYSSLSYIKRFPATELKIDQSFVANILSDKKDEILVKAIISLAKDLGIQPVVEGVESEEVLKKIQSLGSDIIVQGYYFSRPLSSAAYMKWHQQWHQVQDVNAMEI